MSVLIKLVREGLGRVILCIDWVTRPSPVKRTPDQQAVAEAEAKNLSLYQHYLCPFCIKTRRAIHQLNIPVETKELKKHQMYRDELLREGGRIKVPCLRIEQAGAVQWMYESDDIIRYLKDRFH